jgi:ElaB/YqjD/DUF883 family membrane-anchored ribosome-binding protein
MATAFERAAEAVGRPAMESVEENLRQARRVVNTARHAAEDVATDAALNIRRHPFAAVGAAVVVGAVAGGLLGFGAAWFARTRR